MEVNIKSVHWLCQMVIPEMQERKDGSIVIVSSVGGFRGNSMLGAYAISKAADMQLARNLAAEFGPDNIRVNAVCPGLVKTNFARALWEDPQREQAVAGRTPLRRLGEPVDCAGIAVYLASRAGSWTTGQTFTVDGGVLGLRLIRFFVALVLLGGAAAAQPGDDAPDAVFSRQRRPGGGGNRDLRRGVDPDHGRTAAAGWPGSLGPARRHPRGGGGRLVARGRRPGCERGGQGDAP